MPKTVVTAPLKSILKDQIVVESGRCGTCVKVRSKNTTRYECSVLTVMLGQVTECFAWSDDPEWEGKVTQAVAAYKFKGEGN